MPHSRSPLATCLTHNSACTSALISHSSHPFSYPGTRSCLCVSVSALHLLFSSSFAFASSCCCFFTVGVGRLNLDPVSWNLPLTWENPELCSILSPRVSQRSSVPVACGNHLLGDASFISFLLFSCPYFHSYWSFFE